MIPATLPTMLPTLVTPLPTDTRNFEPMVFPRFERPLPRDVIWFDSSPTAEAMPDIPCFTSLVRLPMAPRVMSASSPHREPTLSFAPESPARSPSSIPPAALFKLSRIAMVIFSNAASTEPPRLPTGPDRFVPIAPASCDTASVTSFSFFVIPFASSSMKSGI